MIKHKINTMVSIIVLAAICLCGCGTASNSESNPVNQKVDTQVDTQEKSSISSAHEKKNNQEETFSDDDSSALVVYFSYSGNTKKLAEAIHDQVGGDLRRIETVEAYPEGDAIYDVSEQEASEDARPKYKDLKIDINDYDLSGKVIVPFNTHNGAKDAGTYDRIKKLEPNAIVLEGLPIMGDSMDEDQSEVIREWLERIF